jgi:TorA maturation chaperone TorD
MKRRDVLFEAAKVTNLDQDLTEVNMPDSLQAATLQGLEFVSRVYWGPDREFCQSLYTDGALPTATTGVLRRAVESIGAVIRSYHDAEALFHDLEARYVSLFISSRQGIAAPLYHSCYAGPHGVESEPLLMGEPAVEMRRRMASSGLSLDEGLNQLPDHLCIEIEYLYFLLKAGWDEGDQSRLTEARDFAEDWMLPWVRKFQDRLGAAETAGFYLLVSEMLVELLIAVAGLNTR